MVGYNRIFAKTLAKLMRDALHESSRVHEHQGRGVLLNELGHTVKAAGPLFMGGDGAKLLRRHFYGQLHLPGVTCVDDQAIGSAVRVDVLAADQEPGDFFDRPLGGR